MKPHKGYYSLIQYCPDLSRLETANLGVLLFCPELNFLKALTDEADKRILHFFGLKAKEKKRINALRVAIEERLKRESFGTLEDLKHFIATRANAIQITTPRPVKVYDPEEELHSLFEEIVKGVMQNAEQKKAAEPIRRVLARTFADKNIQQRLRKNISIEVPIFRRQKTIPYAYQNGDFNLIEPVRFDYLKAEETIESRACYYAVEGESIASNLHPDLGRLQLNVVGQFAPEQQEAKEVVRNILTKKGDVKFYTLDDLGRLTHDILTTGKPQAE